MLRFPVFTAVFICLIALFGLGAGNAPVFAGPGLVIEKPVVDFNRAAQGDIVSGSFSLKNASAASLSLEARPGCRCLTIRPERFTLAAGEAGRIDFVLDTSEYDGTVVVDILLIEGGSDRPLEYLKVKGAVVAGTGRSAGLTLPLISAPLNCLSGFDEGLLCDPGTISFVSSSTCPECAAVFQKVEAYARGRSLKLRFFPLEQEPNMRSLATLYKRDRSITELPLLALNGRFISGRARIEAALISIGADTSAAAPLSSATSVFTYSTAILLLGVNPGSFALLFLGLGALIILA